MGPVSPVDELGGRAQRHDQEGRVAVERDQLPGGDLALEGEAGAEPGDEDDEDAGQQHLGGVERRLDAGHPDADAADPLRLRGVPAQEGLLAADAAQHPQAGDGVGAEGREPAGLLALGGLAALERADDEGRAGDEQRHADEDDEAERRRGVSRMTATTT